jgi:glutathione S-transferase
MIQLYWSRAALVLCHGYVKNPACSYERVLTDITGRRAEAPEYLDINPMGKVPGLKDGDAALGEAAAICAYIADRYPEDQTGTGRNRSLARAISAMAVLLACLHRAGADPAVHEAGGTGEHGGVGKCGADLRRARRRLQRVHGSSAKPSRPRIS